MPFLRLTRDRRGIENTFLMHADRPGDRPRLLYWYRTAPGILLGRSPLDEDAIRTIEEQHPDIEFDWPAILALSEVMTPEDEAPAKPQQREQREQRRERRPKGRDRESNQFRETPSASADATSDQLRRDDRTESASARETPDELRRDDRAEEDRGPVESADGVGPEAGVEIAPPTVRVESPRPSGLVEQLAGREIAARLRGRYEEITMRIGDADASVRDALMKRAEALDPDRWNTPEDVLHGVTNADALFEQLRAAAHSSRE